MSGPPESAFPVDEIVQRGLRAYLLHNDRPSGLRLLTYAATHGRPDIHFRLGTFYARSGHSSLAISHFLQCVSLNIRLNASFSSLGSLYYHTRQFDKSFEFFSRGSDCICLYEASKMLFEGCGTGDIGVDEDLGFELLQRAANLGHSKAIRRLIEEKLYRMKMKSSQGQGQVQTQAQAQTETETETDVSTPVPIPVPSDSDSDSDLKKQKGEISLWMSRLPREIAREKREKRERFVQRRLEISRLDREERLFGSLVPRHLSHHQSQSQSQSQSQLQLQLQSQSSDMNFTPIEPVLIEVLRNSEEENENENENEQQRQERSSERKRKKKKPKKGDLLPGPGSELAEVSLFDIEDGEVGILSPSRSADADADVAAADAGDGDGVREVVPPTSQDGKSQTSVQSESEDLQYLRNAIPSLRFTLSPEVGRLNALLERLRSAFPDDDDLPLSLCPGSVIWTVDSAKVRVPSLVVSEIDLLGEFEAELPLLEMESQDREIELGESRQRQQLDERMSFEEMFRGRPSGSSYILVKGFLNNVLRWIDLGPFLEMQKSRKKGKRETLVVPIRRFCYDDAVVQQSFKNPFGAVAEAIRNAMDYVLAHTFTPSVRQKRSELEMTARQKARNRAARALRQKVGVSVREVGVLASLPGEPSAPSAIAVVDASPAPMASDMVATSDVTTPFNSSPTPKAAVQLTPSDIELALPDPSPAIADPPPATATLPSQPTSPQERSATLSKPTSPQERSVTLSKPTSPQERSATLSKTAVSQTSSSLTPSQKPRDSGDRSPTHYNVTSPAFDKPTSHPPKNHAVPALSVTPIEPRSTLVPARSESRPPGRVAPTAETPARLRSSPSMQDSPVSVATVQKLAVSQIPVTPLSVPEADQTPRTKAPMPPSRVRLLTSPKISSDAVESVRTPLKVFPLLRASIGSLEGEDISGGVGKSSPHELATPQSALVSPENEGIEGIFRDVDSTPKRPISPPDVPTIVPGGWDAAYESSPIRNAGEPKKDGDKAPVPEITPAVDSRSDGENESFEPLRLGSDSRSSSEEEEEEEIILEESDDDPDDVDSDDSDEEEEEQEEIVLEESDGEEESEDESEYEESEEEENEESEVDQILSSTPKMMQKKPVPSDTIKFHEVVLVSDDDSEDDSSVSVVRSVPVPELVDKETTRDEDDLPQSRVLKGPSSPVLAVSHLPRIPRKSVDDREVMALDWGHLGTSSQLKPYKLIRLGEISPNPSFHSYDYIYPVGFLSIFLEKGTGFAIEVLDGRSPVFVIREFAPDRRTVARKAKGFDLYKVWSDATSVIPPESIRTSAGFADTRLLVLPGASVHCTGNAEIQHEQQARPRKRKREDPRYQHGARPEGERPPKRRRLHSRPDPAPNRSRQPPAQRPRTLPPPPAFGPLSGETQETRRGLCRPPNRRRGRGRGSGRGRRGRGRGHGLSDSRIEQPRWRH